MPPDPTFLGSVRDVKGASVSVSLDGDTVSGLTFIRGHGYRIGQVGSFVRVPMGYIDLFGVVSQVGAGAVPERLHEVEPFGDRWMTVQLIGEGIQPGRFRRGLGQYPTIGDAVHLLSEEDLARIYGRPDSANYVQVGHLASAESLPALIDIDKLVTRHSAVLGATGAGKSTTVAGLLRALSSTERYPSARILVLDVHGEYAPALRDRATILRVGTSDSTARELLIPYWAMSYDELVSLTFGQLDDAARGFVLEAITELKRASLRSHPLPGVTETTLTVDSPVPFSIHQLWFDLHRLVNATHTSAGGQGNDTEALLLDESGDPVESGDAERVLPPKYRPQSLAAGQDKIYLSSSSLNIRRQLETLASRLRDPRFAFLFDPGPWRPALDGSVDKDVDALLAQWLGDEHSIVVLDLSGVPTSILENLVGVLLRLIYDALFWARNLSEGGRERPLLLVLEEAHAYLGSATSGASVAVRRIAKEGRKYGIGAMIVSQRPAEIDTTVLSQCGTLFAMRLSNASDRAHVTGAVTDNLEGLLATLPVLRTGEAVIVGEAVHLPVRTLIDPPPPDLRPDSSDPLIVNDEGPGGWNRAREPSDYAEVATVWRQQNPRSPRIES